MESRLERLKRLVLSEGERQLNSYPTDELQAMAQTLGIAPREYSRRQLIEKMTAVASRS